MELFEKFRTIRKEKGITQMVMADALNVDVAVISNIEKGKREIKVSELEVISNVFGMSVVDFVGYPKRYIEITDDGDEPMEAILQIKLRKDKRDQVMRLVFGDQAFEILQHNNNR